MPGRCGKIFRSRVLGDSHSVLQHAQIFSPRGHGPGARTALSACFMAAGRDSRTRLSALLWLRCRRTEFGRSNLCYNHESSRSSDKDLAKQFFFLSSRRRSGERTEEGILRNKTSRFEPLNRQRRVGLGVLTPPRPADVSSMPGGGVRTPSPTFRFVAWGKPKTLLLSPALSSIGWRRGSSCGFAALGDYMSKLRFKREVSPDAIIPRIVSKARTNIDSPMNVRLNERTLSEASRNQNKFHQLTDTRCKRGQIFWTDQSE